MKKLCIFDLDGTLLDTLTSIWYCGNRALADYGYEPLDKELYKVMVGDGAAVLVQRMLSEANGDQEKFPEVFAAYKSYFKEGCMYEVKPYHNILNMLTALKEKGIKTAVLSNKPHAQTKKIIMEIFGDQMFDVVFGQRDDVPKKPEPDGVYEILKILDLNQEETLYLGDTNTDMMTGKNAGVFTIGVLWGFRDERELQEAGADGIVSDPLEILEYLI